MEHISESDIAKVASAIAADDNLLEIARKKIEDTLIEFRDACISQPFRGNGLVVKHKDGTPSDIIRLGSESALRIGLIEIAKHLTQTDGDTV